MATLVLFIYRRFIEHTVSKYLDEYLRFKLLKRILNWCQERERKREISCLYRDLRIVLGFWEKYLLIELLNLDKKPDLSLSRIYYVKHGEYFSYSIVLPRISPKSPNT